MEDRIAVKVERLKKRRDFVRARNGARSSARAFALQARKRNDDQSDSGPIGAARFGITVTRKVGNSVVRNRIRRRLREVIRLHAPNCAQSGHDYVLIARKPALSVDFTELSDALVTGLCRVAKKKTYNNHRSYPISRQSKQSPDERKNKLSGRPDKFAQPHSTEPKFHGK